MPLAFPALPDAGFLYLEELTWALDELFRLALDPLIMALLCWPLVAVPLFFVCDEWFFDCFERWLGRAYVPIVFENSLCLSVITSSDFF